MRVIKFRAWDKYHKSWAICELRAKADFRWKFQNPPKGKRVDRSDWQQFTGLLDKNGKGIWEGDIVRLPYSPAAEVKFTRGCFCVHSDGWMIRLEEHNKKWEVIGNIYENPELLK